MKDQEILEAKPDGATHRTKHCYLKLDNPANWYHYDYGKWELISGRCDISEFEDFRSLSDIQTIVELQKRIAELEKQLLPDLFWDANNTETSFESLDEQMSKLSESQKAMLYDALIETFIESKAENYLSLILERDGVDMYEVMIQKIDGMTPAEKNLVLEQKIAELEKELSTVVSGLFSEKELQAHNLEQQAKGIEFVNNYRGNRMSFSQAERRIVELRTQAKQLREEQK